MDILQNIKDGYSGLKLRNKILLPTGVIFFVTYLLFIIYIIQDERGRQREFLEQKAGNMIEYLISAVTESIWNLEENRVRQLSESFLEDREISVISIRHPNNKVIFNKDQNIIGENDIKRKVEIKKNDMLIANLEITFTDYYIEKDIRNIVIKFLIFGIFVFLFLFIFILFASNLSLQPLKSLMSGVKSIKAGNYNKIIFDTSNDELGRLGQAFNEMTQEIKLHNEHLEDLVTQRTIELQDANKKIIDQQEQLLVSARESGMVEMSSGIIHNIGNVINTIGLRLHSSIDQSKDEMSMPVNFIEKNMLPLITNHLETGDLVDFLRNDKKGQKVLEVIIKLLEKTKQLQDDSLIDLEFINSQVIHIADIIYLQQNFVGSLGTEEQVDINVVIKSSIKIWMDSFSKEILL